MPRTFSLLMISSRFFRVTVFVVLMVSLGTAPLSAQNEPAKASPQKTNVRKAFNSKAREQFDRANTNEDDVLTQAEYLKTLRPEHQKIGKRDFLLFDRNQNQLMEYDEYLCTPSIPLEERLIPDPVTDRVQQFLNALQQRFQKGDLNADAQLSEQEFQQARFTATLPGLALTSFTDWDRDQDGQVSQQDIQLLLEIAFGVRAPEGQLLREPGGRVVNWMLFRHLDEDHNNQLSVKELKPRIKDAQQLQEVLKEADQNKDQQLSLEEWKTTKHCWIDPVYYFKRIDKNFDARLDPGELANDTGFHRDLAPYLIPAFDRDGDGVLTLYEYLNTPITNPVVKWHVERKDKDNDGTLSAAEFDWDIGLSARSLIHEYFTLLDQDHNQRLDQREFFFNTNAKTPRKQFDLADKNQDGVLDQTEYLATLKPEHQQIGGRDFLLYDQNQNQLMEYREYLSVPAVPLAQRVVPDPVTDQAQKLLNALLLRSRKWDLDSDGQLSMQEFRVGWPTAAMPGMAFASRINWDRNRDGQITEEEMRLMLEIAYGVRTLDGQLLREPGGRVVNWMLFGHLDLDHNRRLSASELKAKYKDADQLLKQADQNQDRQLSLEEWKTTKYCWIDPVYYFKRIDKNFDARLDPSELASDAGFHRDLAPYLIPAFDRDGDGVLTLYEYLNTPITNPVMKWHVEKKDRDHDGTLSVNEFSRGTGLAGRALINDYFALLDRDHNQRLDKQEFFLQIDLVKAPREIVFKELDSNQDQGLSFDEIFIATKNVIKPGDGIPFEKVMSHTEEEFKQLDLDHDNRLSLDEFKKDLAVVVLPPFTYNPRLAKDFRKTVPVPESDYTILVVMLLNILLVGGVAFYFIRVKLKK
ncbi:EF-hand domain-containing protein [Gimesia fumaroli]|nr:EF-hand domain-containing protein [Gimesia fumaroli]